MSLRVKKELGRIYEGLLSVTVVCLCRVKKAGIAQTSGVNDGSCGEGAHTTRDFLRAWRAAVNRAARDARASQGALMIFRRFLGSLPVSITISQPVQSIHISRTEFIPFSFRKENILEADGPAVASRPFSARRRRSIWLRKTGLDAPCATVNLARDALDESVCFVNAVADA